MSRKRSLKHRYLRFLRRIWPAPTLAAILWSVGACASQSASVGGQARLAPADTVVKQSRDTSRELRYDWEPQLLPTELHLAPEFRSACAPVAELPPSLVLEDADEMVKALEPIASCLTRGPLAHEPLYLLGSSELPGRWDAPIDGSGRADQLRSSLSLLGVPFTHLITHDIDNGHEVELGPRQRRR